MVFHPLPETNLKLTKWTTYHIWNRQKKENERNLKHASDRPPVEQIVHKSPVIRGDRTPPNFIRPHDF